MIPVLGVPVLNRPDLLDRMLASIDYPVGDLVIIDNGDVVRHRPDVPQASRVHLLKMPTNMGVPESWNLIIRSTPFAPYWVIMNSDAWFPPDSLDRLHVAARRDALVLSGGAPAWCCFSIGEQVVSTVGAFDSGLFPAYFEDDDMTRRCTFHGVPIINSGIPVHHDNSSTINSNPVLRAKNDRTFGANRDYYLDKCRRGDFTEGRWSLATRRALSWD